MDNSDSLQTLIYIITLVAMIVLPGIRSYRKFKQQQPETAPFPGDHSPYREEEESSVNEMMREFQRMRERMNLPSTPEVEPDVDLVRYREIAKRRSQERDRKSERDQRFAALFRDNEPEQIEEREGILKHFDVRDAIIYSEIVNRKY
ncbi:MAG: hypothetical protein LBG30_02465 [Odoribacteraceae bacterium]|jgi:hypothetical protein|nr:hypothetical protein [Odoribacteraceae bacterium]